jgi:hypothetical protein
MATATASAIAITKAIAVAVAVAMATTTAITKAVAVAVAVAVAIATAISRIIGTAVAVAVAVAVETSSFSLTSQKSKPADASDVIDLASAREEIRTLRRHFHFVHSLSNQKAEGKDVETRHPSYSTGVADVNPT